MLSIGAASASQWRWIRRCHTCRQVHDCTPAGYAVSIQPIRLPTFEEAEPERFPYGARSEAAVFVGDLLCEEVPALAGEDSTLRIVAIARRPGVLSKVAVRQRDVIGSPFFGIGADHLTRVSRQLDRERIQVVRWQRSADAYIADALGLGEIPPVVLMPGIGHARVLLGEIDVRGIAGWRGYNTALASALTGWRIRLEPVAATAAWQQLHSAMAARRTVHAVVIGYTDRGPRLEVAGLHAVLSVTGREFALGEDVDVRVTRMDADEGRIFASDRLAPSGQLPLM